jgi:hypothetical protein
VRRNPSHKVYDRRWKQHSRELAREAARERLFVGVFPAGIVYADRKREKAGDYARCAFLAYATLKLDIEPDCPAALRALIVADAAKIQARAGELFQVSTSGQSVRLGGALSQVPTGNGSPDLFRDSDGRAFWSDGSRVLVRELELDDADERSAGLLRACLRDFGLTALGCNGSEVRP